MRANHPHHRQNPRIQSRQGVRNLRVGNDHQRAGLARQPAIVRVAHHADNRPRRLFERRPHASADVDLLADRVFFWEVLFLKSFIDQHHTRRRGRVVLVEFAPPQNRNLEQFVVVRRCVHPSRARFAFCRVHRPPDDGERQSELAFDRQAAGGRRILHAGNRIQPFAPFLRKLRHAGRLLVAIARQRHLQREHIVRIESRIHTAQRNKRPDQQRRLRSAAPAPARPR